MKNERQAETEVDSSKTAELLPSAQMPQNPVLCDGLVEYYVRWRHIPMDLRFTPMYLISIDHTQVKAKPNATHWDIAKAIGDEFKSMNINYEDVCIESCQPIT